MKRLALVLFALAAGVAVSSARADDLAVRASVNLGSPAYVAPAQYNGYGYATPSGYWRTITTRVWVPGHWDVSYDGYGRQYSHWDQGHYEIQTRRVWVNYAPRYNWQEHERQERHEWQEHERREHDWREHRFGDRDDDRDRR